MLVANYKESKKGLFFANTYTSKNYAFYSSEKDALYGVNPNLAFIYSPTDPEVVERLKGQGITDYVLTEMRRTRMVKLEDINFTKVKDKEILAIDFTNTVTKIQVKKGDNIGFITEDGRKGIMNIAGASGRYIDFKCKTQTIPQ